jgi:hypothetical protein
MNDDAELSFLNEDFQKLLAEEAAKRDRNWDPAERWKAIQGTIAWAEQQRTVRRNTREACLANQARLLAARAAKAAPHND